MNTKVIATAYPLDFSQSINWLLAEGYRVVSANLDSGWYFALLINDSTPSDNHKCERCRHFYPFISGKDSFSNGECRYNPPVECLNLAGFQSRQYPVCFPEDSCQIGFEAAAIQTEGGDA